MEDKLARIEDLAMIDLQYRQMMRDYKALEKKFDRVVGQLPEDVRGTVWDYVMLCEDMSIRKLQLACILIERI